MYRYKYDKSYNHKSRKARHTIVLAALVSTIVVGVGGYVAYDVIKQTFDKQAPISRSNFSSVQGDSVNVFSSSYFQFQAGDNWKEATSEEKDGHYVYRSYRGTLVAADISIDVNQKEPLAQALMRNTHVFPVTIDPSGRLLPQGDSGEDCKTFMPKGAPNIPTLITSRQVKFVCTPDAVIFQVTVGVIGGGTDLSLPRPSGGKGIYTLTYRDLSLEPTDSQLRSIINTFQTR